MAELRAKTEDQAYRLPFIDKVMRARIRDDSRNFRHWHVPYPGYNKVIQDSLPTKMKGGMGQC
jgi:hypothetical protein